MDVPGTDGIDTGARLRLVREPEPGSALAALDRSVLDAEEQERVRTCRNRAGGVLYATAYIAVRRLLGHALDTAAEAITFEREARPHCGRPHGRPVVSRPARPVSFSLSHCRGLVLVGLASGQDRIGVGVEPRPTRDTAALCAPYLHAGERAVLDALPERDAGLGFGRSWTRKEAYLKGVGTGIVSLAANDVSVDPPGWTVFDVPCGPAHIASAALRRPGARPVPPRRLAPGWLLAGGQGAPEEESAVGKSAARPGAHPRGRRQGREGDRRGTGRLAGRRPALRRGHRRPGRRQRSP